MWRSSISFIAIDVTYCGLQKDTSTIFLLLWQRNCAFETMETAIKGVDEKCCIIPIIDPFKPKRWDSRATQASIISFLRDYIIDCFL